MTSTSFFSQLGQLLGLAANTTSHAEKLLSALGGALSITGILGLSIFLSQHYQLDQFSTVLIVASMGASAVLLFAVPHGALSQPWALIGGHVISGFIGISCVKLFGNSIWVAGSAVGLAIAAMYYLRCIHPPGGATALTTVIGGHAINELGYHYLLMPVALNIVIMLTCCLLFNNLFHWRRYPAHLAHKHKRSIRIPGSDRQFELSHEDFAAAMQQLDSYVDITPEGLAELLELAKQHAEKHITHPEQIIAGRFYSNGKLGNLWSIRQIVDASPQGTPSHQDKVIYKVLAGDGAYQTGICLRREFHQWARFEVLKHQQQWLKIESE